MFSYYNQYMSRYNSNEFNYNFGILSWHENDEKIILDKMAYEIRFNQDYGAFLDSVELIIPHLDFNYYLMFKNKTKVFCNLEKYYYNKHLIEYLSMMTNDSYAIKNSNTSIPGMNPFKRTPFKNSMAQSHIISVINDIYNISHRDLEKIFIK